MVKQNPCSFESKSPIHILAASDNRYLVGLYTMLTSCAVSNNFEDALVFHVIDTGIHEAELPRFTEFFKRFPNVRVEFHKVDEALFKSCTLKFRGGISAYSRLTMGDLLAGIQKCIYIDVDILVLRNVRELWDIPADGNILMAKVDDYWYGNDHNTLANDCPYAPKEEIEHYDYFNSGVIVCDLDAYRRTGVFQKMLELLMSHGHLTSGDQPVINYVCRGKIGKLPYESNVLASLAPQAAGDYNYHFTGLTKPWKYAGFGTGGKLWTLFNSVFVRKYFRYNPPLGLRLKNAIFPFRSLFGALFPSVFCFFIRQNEGKEMAEVKRECFLKYRNNLSRGGLDAESYAYYMKKKKEWKSVAKQSHRKTGPFTA